MAKQVTAQEAQAPATQNQNTTVAKKETVKSLFESPEIKQRIAAILDKNAPQFITSVIQLVNSDKNLAECKPLSVINAAMTAATLNLPLNNNLGFAYVIPYNVREGNVWIKKAQFQLGYKGFRQLALRTNQFIYLNQNDVREGEMIKRDRLTGEIEFNWIINDSERLKLPIIGYVSFFQLSNGFRSTFYMSNDELEAHALKYSKVYAKDKTGLWATDRPAMCAKTVTKMNISKNAPLSVEDVHASKLFKAIKADQAIIDPDGGFTYPDNDTNDADFTIVDPKDKATAAENATMDKINENANKNAG